MSSNKRISLKDLSKILNVSISTISKALNDSPEISEKTKNRVKETATLYNYQPNKLAVQLKSGKSNTIGVIVPSIQNNYFTEVLSGIEQVLEKAHYSMIISITNESHTKEVASVDTLSSGLTDGLIISLSEETQTLKKFSHLGENQNYTKPIVMFDRVASIDDISTVEGNETEAVFHATQLFINAGKKRIALLTTINSLSVAQLRISGYKNALAQNQITFEGDLLVTSEANNVDVASEMLLLEQTPDAIITLDEEATLSIMKVLKKLNVRVPEQLQIIGYANERLAENLTPRVTTVNQFGYQMGQNVANLLLEQIKDNTSISSHHIIPAKIVHRDTTIT